MYDLSYLHFLPFMPEQRNRQSVTSSNKDSKKIFHTVVAHLSLGKSGSGMMAYNSDLCWGVSLSNFLGCLKKQGN